MTKFLSLKSIWHDQIAIFKDFDIYVTDKKETTTPSKVAALWENENWTEMTSNLQVRRKFSSVQIMVILTLEKSFLSQETLDFVM